MAVLAESDQQPAGMVDDPIPSLALVAELNALRRRVAELETCERLWRTVTEEARDHIFIVDRTARFEYVNWHLARLVGSTAEQITGKLLEDLFPPEVAAQQRSALARVIETGQPEVNELRLSGPGPELWVHTRLAPLFGAHGGVQSVFGIARDISDRKRAEDKLRQAESRNRAILAALPDLMFVVSREGLLTDYHAASLEELACPPEQLLGKHIREVLPSSVAEAALAAMERAGTSGSVQVIEYQLRTMTGQVGDYEARIAPTGAGGGLILVRDVTERKQAERALRESKERLCFALQSIEAAEWELDLADHTVNRSPHHDRIFGYETPLPRWTMETFLEHVAPEERELAVRTLRQGVEAAQAWSCEFRIVRCDQAVRWILTCGRPRLDANGKPTHMVGIVQDITARKRAEEALRLASVYNRSLIEASLDPLVAIGPDGRITDASKATEQMTGFPRTHLIGTDFADYFTEPERARAGYQQAFRDGFVRDYPLDLKHRNGHATSVLYNASVYRDESGQVIGVFAAARDLTERKRAAEAEAANRAKSEFLAVMSHEIRTPMNGIIGMTGLLLDTALSPEQTEYAEAVRSSANGLLAIINDILDFSKIETGKLLIEAAPFDLCTTLFEIVDLLAPGAGQKELELAVRLPPEGPYRVLGDAGRIRQVLMNLIGNAIKFTERGHVLADVEYHPASDTQGLFKFSIRDTGCGIPADKLAALFTKFTQVDSSPRRRTGGTGLGLAITKQLVELMGGSIGAESEAGSGSTFWFTLPLPLVSPEAVPPRLPVELLRGIRVLVMDEHEVCRRVLHELCGAWGMCAEQASSTAEALRMLPAAAAAGVPFRIALLDCHTLRAGGLDLASALEAEAAASGLDLVTLRSWTLVKCGIHCRDGGCRVVLRKPVRPEALFAAMTKALGLVVSSTTCAGEQDHPRASSMERLAEHLAAPRYPRRVLLVEDNAINQKVGLRLLEKMGCRVDVAANGREALAMVQRFPYDLVLMDVQMPEMDGLEATARIREQEAHGSHLPIIAMTAGAMAEDRERCLQSGMDDYIAKPVDREQLRRVLAEWGPRRNEPAFSSEALPARS